MNTRARRINSGWAGWDTSERCPSPSAFRNVVVGDWGTPAVGVRGQDLILLMRSRSRFRNAYLVGEQGLRSFGPSYTASSEDLGLFHARINTASVGGVHLTKVEASHVRILRPGGALADHYGDFYQLYFVLNGTIDVEQGGTCQPVGADEAVLIDAAELFSVTFAAAARTVHIHVARAELRELEGLAVAPRKFKVTMTGSLARELITTLLSTDQMSWRGNHGIHVGLAASQLAKAVLLEDIDTSELRRNGRDEVRNRVLRLIHQSAARQEVCADWVASQIGVSRRYLDSIFEGSSSGVAATIRRERVALAGRHLTSDISRALSIEVISSMSGFGSSATLPGPRQS